MADQPTGVLKKFNDKAIDRVAEGTVALVAVSGLWLLNRYGDKTFDVLEYLLGKKQLLAAAFLLLCALGYCLVVLLRRKRVFRNRRLYFKKGEESPLCPNCYEVLSKGLHMFPVSMMDEDIECWGCHMCQRNYAARKGEDFKPLQQPNVLDACRASVTLGD